MRAKKSFCLLLSGVFRFHLSPKLPPAHSSYIPAADIKKCGNEFSVTYFEILNFLEQGAHRSPNMTSVWACIIGHTTLVNIRTQGDSDNLLH